MKNCVAGTEEEKEKLYEKGAGVEEEVEGEDVEE